MQVVSTVKKAKKGDDEAFIQLIEIHKEYMYKISCAYLKNDNDCSDAIQETILAMYQNIYRLKTPCYFKTWMTKILINKCNDIIKAKKRIVPIDEYIEANNYSCMNMDVEELEFRSIIEPLREEYRTVLVLYYLENYSIKEISRLISVPQGTVKSRLYRGREEFKRIHFGNKFVQIQEVCNE